MRIKINVTKEILKQSMYCNYDPGTGKRLSNNESNTGRNCGIANVICDLLPYAWVSNESIWIFDEEPSYKLVLKTMVSVRVKLPIKAICFIQEFDKLLPDDRALMDPISFGIDIPDEVINRIGINEVESILLNSLTLEKVSV